MKRLLIALLIFFVFVNKGHASYLSEPWLLQGGNIFGEPFLVGSLDDFPIQFLVGGDTYFTINTDGSIGLGTSTPDFALELFRETSGNIGITAFPGDATFIGRRSNGTPASPTAVLANENLVQLTGTGRDSSTTWATPAPVWMVMEATQNFTPAHHGARIDYYTTDNDTTTLSRKFRIDHDGSLIATPTNPGDNAVQFAANSIGDAEVSDTLTCSTFATDPANCAVTECAGGVTAAGVAEACLDPITEAELASLSDLDTQIGITGTPSGTTYWRGDNSWATPPDTDTDTTCLDAGVDCHYAGSASEGGAASDVACTTCITMGTETSGSYVNGITANQGLAATGAGDEKTLGLKTCTDGQILKNSSGTSWDCAADSGGTVLKDVVTTSPLTGGENDVLPGADADLTLAITMQKDLVTTAPLTGGTNDILPGSDSDVTVALAAGSGDNGILIYDADAPAGWENRILSTGFIVGESAITVDDSIFSPLGPTIGNTASEFNEPTEFGARTVNMQGSVLRLPDGDSIDLTCGASQQGRFQIMDSGVLQWCDGTSPTSVLRSIGPFGSSIDGSEITNGTIAAVDMQSSSVVGGTGGTISDNTITAADIASEAVETDEIKNGTITYPDISNSITIAGNPALAVNTCFFSANGLVCEGSITGGEATIEGLLAWSPTTQDQTLYLPDLVSPHSGTSTLVATDLAQTLTQKTINAESIGNVITTVERVWFPAAGCNNTTATSFFDLPTANAPAVACRTGTNVNKGVLLFNEDTDQFAQTSLVLPSDWTGAIDVAFWWTAAPTSGTVTWCAQLVCVGDSETADPAFPAQATGNCVQDTVYGTTDYANRIVKAGLTATTCTASASEIMQIRISRDANGDVYADSLAADARLIGTFFTFRRAQ